MDLRSRPRSPLRTTLEIAPGLVHRTRGPILEMRAMPPAPQAPAFAHVHAVAGTPRHRRGRPARLLAGGSALTWEHAWAKAVGEAVERHAVLDWEPPVRVASARELDPGIDVQAFDLFHAEQRAQANFAFERLREDSRIGWVAAYSLTRRTRTFLPATLAHMFYEPRTPADRFDLCPVSGYACGNTLEEALLGALCEVAERDALMLCWYQRLAVPALDLASFDSATVRDALARFAHAPVRLYCADLTTDARIPALLVMMTSAHPGWPAAAVATAADLSPARALVKALSELSSGQALVQAHRRAGGRLPRSAHDVVQPEDHGLFYAAPQALRHLDTLLRPRRTVRADPAAGGSTGNDVKADLDVCLQRLAACGLEALAVELTPPEIAARGLRVVKVVVPGMLPIDFGRATRHLGGPRLYSAPLRMGHAQAATRPGALNRMPHPFP